MLSICFTMTLKFLVYGSWFIVKDKNKEYEEKWKRFMINGF